MCFQGATKSSCILRIAKRRFQTGSTPSHIHFEAFSRKWWDIDGPLSTLHDYLNVRLSFIAKSYCLLNSDPLGRHGNLATTNVRFSRLPIFKHANERASIHLEETLKGAKILDVGCGGGILSESLAKCGAKVLGIDPSEGLIQVAETHRVEDFATYNTRFGLKNDYYGNLSYRATTLEDYINSGEVSPFDIVVASEVLEHIENRCKPSFIDSVCRVVKPGGLAVFTTPGRTLKSFVTNIFIAESVLKLVPPRSHSYELFIAPNDIVKLMKARGFSEVHRQGVFYLPYYRRFIHIPHCDYLYMISFRRDS